MALIRRVSRLITADMHAVLDQIEEPETVLKQAIREMEEELARQEQRGRWKAREIESTSARIVALEKALTDLDSKLDLCFANNNEELARRLTRRKLEASKLRENLNSQCAALTDDLADYQARVAKNRDELEGMRQKAVLLCTSATFDSDTRSSESFTDIDDAEVEIAFMAEKETRKKS